MQYYACKHLSFVFECLLQCDYEDNIEFQGKDDRFQVWLRAPAPCHAIEVPESVLLPLCAVKHSTHTSFVLRNVRYMCMYFIKLMFYFNKQMYVFY